MSDRHEKPPIPTSLAAQRNQGPDAITLQSDGEHKDTAAMALETVLLGLSLASGGFEALALVSDETANPHLIDAALLTEYARAKLAEGGAP